MTFGECGRSRATADAMLGPDTVQVVLAAIKGDTQQRCDRSRRDRPGSTNRQDLGPTRKRTSSFTVACRGQS